MANASPQNRFNVVLTRSQLELLSQMIDQELHALESGYAHPNPKLLKRTFDVLWQHRKPSPEQQEINMQCWRDKINARRQAAVDLRPAS